MEKPNYYGILPAKIRYDKRLKPMEKILYTEITALVNIQGFCFASNSYFANLYEVHKNTVGIWINNLIEYGYIKVKMIFKENSKEVLERRLYIENIEKEENTPINKKVDTLSTKSLVPPQQKNGDPINEKIEDNITSINTTSNNTTTKLDKVNKIEQEEASTKSSSSFILENNNSEEIEKDSSSLNAENKKKLEISKIIYVLSEFGVSDKTIENIIKLDITLEKVKEVLRVVKEKNWGEGAIYKALKENWKVGSTEEKIFTEKDLRKKLAGRANILLDDFEKNRIDYDSMIENYIEFCSNPIFTEELKIEYYDKLRNEANKSRGS